MGALLACTGAVEKALKKVLTIAGRQGIDAEAAADVYKAHHLTLGADVGDEQQPSDGAPRWHQRYVRLLMAARGRQVLASNSGDLAALSSEAAAVLVAKASKRQAHTLNTERQRLEWQNGIDTPWAPDSAEYMAALGRVRQQEMDALQFKTMQVVYELNHAYSMRAVMGTAGAQTREVRSLSKGMRQKLLSLLDQMYVWQTAGTEEEPGDVALSPEQIDDMLRTGEMPPEWHGGDAHSASELHIGKLFHQHSSDQARVQEELQILPIEKQRLISHLQYFLGQVECELGGQPALSGLTDAELEKCSASQLVALHARQQLGDGAHTLLRRHQHRMRAMLDRCLAMQW
jgi:hypothetical protein